MGQNTYNVTKYAMPKFAKKHNILFQQLEYGSHLFPMEYPDQTATLIKEAIIELGGST